MRLAFTLIELLVVITVIVVLLALLTPALDKAIYQAELASCGSRMKAWGNISLAFAYAHQRALPMAFGPDSSVSDVYGTSPETARVLDRINNVSAQ